MTDTDAVRAARQAERHALALLMGTAADVSAARAALRLALHQADTHRRADAVRAFRSGTPIWAVPTMAPWSGFGEVLTRR